MVSTSTPVIFIKAYRLITRGRFKSVWFRITFTLWSQQTLGSDTRSIIKSHFLQNEFAYKDKTEKQYQHVKDDSDSPKVRCKGCVRASHNFRRHELQSSAHVDRNRIAGTAWDVPGQAKINDLKSIKWIPSKQSQKVNLFNFILHPRFL